jgi:hypothetical protein
MLCCACLVTASTGPHPVRHEGHAKGKPPTNKAATATSAALPQHTKPTTTRSHTADMQGCQHAALQEQHSSAAAAAWWLCMHASVPTTPHVQHTAAAAGLQKQNPATAVCCAVRHQKSGPWPVHTQQVLMLLLLHLHICVLLTLDHRPGPRPALWRQAAAAAVFFYTNLARSCSSFWGDAPTSSSTFLPSL